MLFIFGKRNATRSPWFQLTSWMQGSGCSWGVSMGSQAINWTSEKKTPDKTWILGGCQEKSTSVWLVGRGNLGAQIAESDGDVCRATAGKCKSLRAPEISRGSEANYLGFTTCCDCPFGFRPQWVPFSCPFCPFCTGAVHLPSFFFQRKTNDLRNIAVPQVYASFVCQDWMAFRLLNTSKIDGFGCATYIECIIRNTSSSSTSHWKRGFQSSRNPRLLVFMNWKSVPIRNRMKCSSEV